MRVIRATLERTQVDLLALRLMVSAVIVQGDDPILRHAVFGAWLKADEALQRVTQMMSEPAPGGDREEIAIHD